MNPLKYIMILNSEPCPCGSGKKYNECCKGKVAALDIDYRIPLDVQVMNMMNKSLKKCCMHPDQRNCKGKIKGAHALQNQKIISLLAGNSRHVYVMDARKKPIIFNLQNEPDVHLLISKTSANKATTETCFCDYHDNVVFSAIEKGAPNFDENNEEMKFLYAYKAFVFEYYKHQSSFDIYRKCFKTNPQGFTNQHMIRIYRMHEIKDCELKPVKDHFDKEIMNGTCNGILTKVIDIPKQIKFANYAYIAPNYDLNGNRIKHTNKGIMHRLSLTIFPESEKSYILLSCLENDSSIYLNFFNQLKEAPLEKVMYYFSVILPLYSENIVLSPMLWEKWDEEKQMYFNFYANSKFKDFKNFDKCIGYGLKNIAANKTDLNYYNRLKFNLFI